MKTTIILPEYLHEAIKRMAAVRKKSMGAFIRETLEERAGKEQPKPRSLGMAASDGSGIARRIEELYEPEPWRS